MIGLSKRACVSIVGLKQWAELQETTPDFENANQN